MMAGKAKKNTAARGRIRQGIRFWRDEHATGRKHPNYEESNASLLIARKWLSEGVMGKERILDIGAGAGKITSGLRDKMQSVVSLEPTNIAMHAHEIPQVSIKGISQELPFKSGSFDRALMAYSLDYAPSIEKAIEEAKRVVKRGGTLVVLLHKPRSDYTHEIEGEFMELRELAYRLKEWSTLGLWSQPFNFDGTGFYTKTKKEFDEKTKSVERKAKYLERMLVRQERLFGSEQKTADYFRSHGFAVEQITSPFLEHNGEKHYTGYALLLKNK